MSELQARLSARPIATLVTSFFVICLLGCTGIFIFWMSSSPSQGLMRCAAFIVAMGGVHLIGYFLWKRQSENVPRQTVTRQYTGMLEAYGASLWSAAVQQFVIIFFAAMMLDRGRMLRLTLMASLASWLLALIILLRRPKTPTEDDLSMVKYGFWFFVPLASIIASIMGREF